MDAGHGSVAEVAQCYRELRQVNRHLSGFRATFRPLERLGLRSGRLTVLDIAGGDGDFARRFDTLARSHDLDPTICVLDLNPVTVGLVEQRRRSTPGIVPVLGDALALPFGDEVFDVVHAAAFFHHLSNVHARDLLSEMCRVSRRLVVVNDLVRSYVAYGAIWILTRLLSDNRLIRHDGPLSVLKSFVPHELRAVARSTGPIHAPGFRWALERTFPYRMTLIGARVPAS